MNINFPSLTNSNSIPIIQYDKDGNEIKKWKSISEINLFYGTTSLSYYLDKDIKFNGFYWKREIQIEILLDEKWFVVNYKGISFNVSSEGRIKRKNGRITYGSKNAAGYMTFKQCGKNFLIHRIVMMGKEYREDNVNLEVDHINMQKDCNKFSNLRWCTHQQNTQYSHDLSDKNRYMWKIAPVSMYDLNGKYIDSFDSQTEASEIMNIYTQNISHSCINGGSSGGFQWRFLNEQNKNVIYQK